MSNHRRASFLLIHSAVDALRSVCNPFCGLKHFNDWTNLFHSQLVVIVIITLDCRFRITFTQCKQLLQFLFHYFFRIKYAECVGYIKTHITSLSVRGCLTSSLYSGASILSLLTCESGIRVRDRFIMVSIWHENSGENVNGKEHNFIERRIKFFLNIKKKMVGKIGKLCAEYDREFLHRFQHIALHEWMSYMCVCTHRGASIRARAFHVRVLVLREPWERQNIHKKCQIVHWTQLLSYPHNKNSDQHQ